MPWWKENQGLEWVKCVGTAAARAQQQLIKRCSGANFLLTYFSWQGYSNP